MKTVISSYTELLKAMKKNNLLGFENRWYMNDRHKRTVKRNLVQDLGQMGVLEKTQGSGFWFENAFRLKEHFRKLTSIKDIRKRVKDIAIYEADVKRRKEKGALMKDYRCPHCAEQLSALLPKPTPEGEEVECWDTLSICPYCGGHFMRFAYSNGEVETKVPQQRKTRK